MSGPTASRGSTSGVPTPFALPLVIAPAALVADQNDYNPASLASNDTLQLSATNGPVSITGLQGGAAGRIILIYNTGTVPIHFQREAVASAAANRFAFNDSLWLGANEAVVLVYDATASRWRKCYPGPGPAMMLDPTRRVLFSDDFSANSQGSTVSGTGATNATSTQGVDATDRAAGVNSQSTGTTTTGRTAHGLFGASTVQVLQPGLGMVFAIGRIALGNLSTVAEEYIYRIGVWDNINAGDAVNGVYWEYDRLTAGDFWRTVTSAASARTKNTTTLAVTSPRFIWLGIVINAAWSRATFIYSTDGEIWNLANTGDITTNMPTVGPLTMFWKIEKSAGTTARLSFIDAFLLSCEYRRGV